MGGSFFSWARVLAHTRAARGQLFSGQVRSQCEFPIQGYHVPSGSRLLSLLYGLGRAVQAVSRCLSRRSAASASASPPRGVSVGLLWGLREQSMPLCTRVNCWVCPKSNAAVLWQLQLVVKLVRFWTRIMSLEVDFCRCCLSSAVDTLESVLQPVVKDLLQCCCWIRCGVQCRARNIRNALCLAGPFLLGVET